MYFFSFFENIDEIKLQLLTKVYKKLCETEFRTFWNAQNNLCAKNMLNCPTTRSLPMTTAPNQNQ